MFENDYEATPVDSEVLLSEEPSDLTKGHIRDQFKNPSTMRYDYVSTFIENYNYTMDTIYDEDVIDDINAVTDTFVKFMMNILTKYYGIGFPELEEKSTETQLDVLHMVYRYFILRMKHNISSYCMNYIKKHKRELLDMFSEKKDIASVNLLNDGIDASDVILISNLYEIVNYILEQETDVDEFLAHSDMDEPNLETEEMVSYYETFTLVGNFTAPYMDHAKSDRGLIKEVEIKLRNKILKPYKKLFKKVVPSESNTLVSEEDSKAEE